MDNDNIAALLAQGEGPQLAFLKERHKLDELAETLVALANAQGGTLLIGVSGRARGKPEGLRDMAAAREAALDAAIACTPPLILPLPRTVAHEGASLLLISVPPGLPHVYSLHGKYLRREGATNQPLLPDALRRLLLERGEVSWERSAPEGALLADLDPAKVTAYARRLGPEAEGDELGLLLRRGCLLRQDEGRKTKDESTSQQADLPSAGLHPSSSVFRPTNAGLLLFARAVEARFPQAEITLVQYRGRELADEFEREDIHDTLPEAVRRAERWLVEHMRKGSRMRGLEREDWVQFPQAAVREALVNAVAHRDYSVRGEGIRLALFADRLEVYSPGRLPGHVTLENIVQERFSRNETLVQVLADMGLIERLGYGIDRMLRQMAEAGLPPPSFRETAAGFLVVLQGQGYDEAAASGIDTRELARQGLNERQIAAIVYLTEQRRISNGDLQELHPSVSAETIRRDLADLVERGLLLKVGEKRATYYILR
jgi:ATP-dependent DNA helicase RecG